MEEFWTKMLSSWWGITILCVICMAIWVILSIVFYKQFFKRFYDIVLGLIAMLLLSPLFLILTIVGAVVMKGNPFFIQERPGKIDKKTGEQKIIKLLKFRTMTNEKDESGNLLSDEKRLNRYGQLLRECSLDELLSIYNIVKGDLSIVGPRPLLKKDLLFMNEHQRRRHEIRQGLTGLAQVKGRNSISWEQKFLYDEEYLANMSLWLDLKIIFMTVAVVFRRNGVTREGTVSDIDYGDWLLQEGKITTEEYMLKMQGVCCGRETEIVKDWKYYNHAWIPVCAPHQIPDLTPLKNGELFRNGGFLARYTTDFDCPENTGWWYTIQDKVFDISALKSKRRYIITSGVKNFDVRKIDPQEFREELYVLTCKAIASYSLSRQIPDKQCFFEETEQWAKYGSTYGAFHREENKITGYALIKENEEFIDFSVQKTDPDFEKLNVGAALVYRIVSDCAKKVEAGKYICDGARNILHETNFQEYLEKYFGFRKAFCKLHIVYASKYRLLIHLAYPLRGLVRKLSKIQKFKQLNGIMKMEEITRRQSKP